MAYVDTDNPTLLRDTASRALMATDKTGLLRNRAARNKALKMQQQQTDVERRVQSMHDRLDRCETLLHELVQHVSALVAKLPVSDPTIQE